MLRAALLASVLSLVSVRGSGSDEPPQPRAVGCGDCRVTFMKCLVAGKDLPPEARKEHNERCSSLAASCYKGCTD